MDDTVREGFICPICRRELDSLAALQDHFETAHSSEDKAGFKAVKGLVGWAKRKIRREDAPVSAGTSDGRGEVEATRLRSGSEASGIDPVLWAPQEFGTFFTSILAVHQQGCSSTIVVRVIFLPIGGGQLSCRTGHYNDDSHVIMYVQTTHMFVA